MRGRHVLWPGVALLVLSQATAVAVAASTPQVSEKTAVHVIGAFIRGGNHANATLCVACQNKLETASSAAIDDAYFRELALQGQSNVGQEGLNAALFREHLYRVSTTDYPRLIVVEGLLASPSIASQSPAPATGLYLFTQSARTKSWLEAYEPLAPRGLPPLATREHVAALIPLTSNGLAERPSDLARLVSDDINYYYAGRSRPLIAPLVSAYLGFDRTQASEVVTPGTAAASAAETKYPEFAFRTEGAGALVLLTVMVRISYRLRGGQTTTWEYLPGDHFSTLSLTLLWQLAVSDPAHGAGAPSIVAVDYGASTVRGKTANGMLVSVGPYTG